MFLKSGGYTEGKIENMAVLLTYGFRCGGTSYSVAVILMQRIICYFYILLEIEFILDELFYIKTKCYLLANVSRPNFSISIFFYI